MLGINGMLGILRCDGIQLLSGLYVNDLHSEQVLHKHAHSKTLSSQMRAVLVSSLLGTLALGLWCHVEEVRMSHGPNILKKTHRECPEGLCNCFSTAGLITGQAVGKESSITIAHVADMIPPKEQSPQGGASASH